MPWAHRPIKRVDILISDKELKTRSRESHAWSLRASSGRLEWIREDYVLIKASGISGA